ncbi:MAG: YggS family pyridoxal phosphate-dependent enzyme [Gemmatimonadota bacterium]
MARVACESDAEPRAGEESALERVYRDRLRESLPRIEAGMAEAAVRSGREASAVRLVAVTKGHPVAALRAAWAEGIADLGENRPEILVERRGLLPAGAVRWHLIGHVQRRKAREAAEAADLFHALDSERLAERLSRVLEEEGRVLPVLLQVNTSGETVKGGFEAAEALDALGRVLELPGLEVRGLMTMAPFVEDEGWIRRTFRRLRELHEQATALSRYQGTELSMGMTHDFEIAIEEGSTMIRVGTALFGERA